MKRGLPKSSPVAQRRKEESAPLIRLVDYIRAGRPIAQMGAAMLDAGHWEAMQSRLQDHLRRVPIIVADNIDEFTLDHQWSTQVGDKLDPHDVPNLVPPFLSYWYEWRWADPKVRKLGLRMAGVLVESIEVPPGEGNPPEHHWEISALPFFLTDEGRIYHPVFLPVAWSNDAGDLVANSVESSPFMSHGCDLDKSDPYKRLAFTALTCTLIGVTFLNCKNVGLIDAPAAPPKLNRAHHAKTGEWLSRTKLIEITPMSSILKRLPAETETDHRARSLHLVRGHFKRYSDQGLFGKTKGTFFWRQQARGSLEIGESQPRYAIRLDGKGPKK